MAPEPDVLIEHEFKSFVRTLLAEEAAESQDRSGLPDPRLRRADLAAVLAYHEEQLRLILHGIRGARAEAIWDATWQLREDVLAACDRATATERAARWVREE